MPVLIGTSGWQYRDWRGGLYPAGVAQRRWLEHYAGYYLTVENNASFYRLPAGRTLRAGCTRTPGDFVMAVKASRYLTHVRKLRDPAEPVARLLGAAAALGPKLGPVLLQLPPDLKAKARPCWTPASPRSGTPRSGHGRLRIAVEPRHTSWWTEEVRQILAAHDAALCWADRLGRPVTPLWGTTEWGYLRFHEGTADPWPCYAERDLGLWAGRVRHALPPGADVYVYFNNDPGGAAVVNSATFAALARNGGLIATRTPRSGGVPLTPAIPTW